jgi:hypothetical protein
MRMRSPRRRSAPAVRGALAAVLAARVAGLAAALALAAAAAWAQDRGGGTFDYGSPFDAPAPAEPRGREAEPAPGPTVAPRPPAAREERTRPIRPIDEPPYRRVPPINQRPNRPGDQLRQR